MNMHSPLEVVCVFAGLASNYPQEELNLYLLLRREILYPLSYGGVLAD